MPLLPIGLRCESSSSIVMPLMNCEHADFGLTIVPAAKTPSRRGTRISPVSVLTHTSTN
jgi:hypothetical protein